MVKSPFPVKKRGPVRVSRLNLDRRRQNPIIYGAPRNKTKTMSLHHRASEPLQKKTHPMHEPHLSRVERGSVVVAGARDEGVTTIRECIWATGRWEAAKVFGRPFTSKFCEPVSLCTELALDPSRSAVFASGRTGRREMDVRLPETWSGKKKTMPRVHSIASFFSGGFCFVVLPTARWAHLDCCKGNVIRFTANAILNQI